MYRQTPTLLLSLFLLVGLPPTSSAAASDAQVDVHRNDDGRVSRILGPIELPTNEQGIVASVRTWLVTNAPAIGEDSDRIDRLLDSGHLEDLTADQDLVVFNQSVDEVPIHNAETRVVVEGNAIIGIAGVLFSDFLDETRVVDDDDRLSSLEAALSRYEGVSLSASRNSAVFDADEDVSGKALYEIDATTGRPSWFIEDSSGLQVISDAETGQATRVKSLARHANSNASMRHRNFDIDHWGDVDSSDPDDFDTASCKRVGSGTCTWTLEYDASSYGIEVIDYDSGEDSASGICSGTPTPTFTSGSNYSTSSHFRQADAYYWLKKAKDTYSIYGTPIIPSNTDNSRLYIDYSGYVCGYPSSPACYLANNIYLVYTTKLPTIFHEFGHHIDSWHGSWGYGCSSSDDSDSIAETTAEIYTMISLLAHFNDNSMDYGVDYKGVFADCSSCVDKRHYGTTKLDVGVYDCSDTPHYQGMFFRTAIWEILFNLDCDEDTTCSSTTQWNNDIGWSSRADARQSIYRATLYANKILPASAEFEDLALWMYVYLNSNRTSTIATNFKKVIEHHGLDF